MRRKMAELMLKVNQFATTDGRVSTDRILTARTLIGRSMTCEQIIKAASRGVARLNGVARRAKPEAYFSIRCLNGNAIASFGK